MNYKYLKFSNEKELIRIIISFLIFFVTLGFILIQNGKINNNSIVDHISVILGAFIGLYLPSIIVASIICVIANLSFIYLHKIFPNKNFFIREIYIVLNLHSRLFNFIYYIVFIFGVSGNILINTSNNSI